MIVSFNGSLAVAKTVFLLGAFKAARSLHTHSKIRPASSSATSSAQFFTNLKQNFKQPNCRNNMASTTDASILPKDLMDASAYNFTWQQTMLRIKDPKVSVPFYEDLFGFKLIHFYNFPQWNFSLYFLAFLPDEEKFDLIPGSPESEKYLWSCKGDEVSFPS